MALPDQTLELTNSQHMPPVSELTGQELVPVAAGTQQLPGSFTPTIMGDYVLGLYTDVLPNYPTGAANPASTLIIAENSQAYKITIADIVGLAQPTLVLSGSGLVQVLDVGGGNRDIYVPIASIEECDEALINDKAVTPLGLSNYKARIEELEDLMDQLLYVPTDVTGISINPSTVEIGSTVASVTINWTINKTITNQTMTNNTNPLTPEARSVTITGPFNTDRTWTLTATDGQTSDSASTSLAFRNKRYWGVSPNTSLTNAEIIALSSEFSTTKNKSVTYNATGGRYVYYCYPSAFGDLTAVKVGGLAFSDFTVTATNFTNSSGYASQYNVVRINNIQTGANIQVDWA